MYLDANPSGEGEVARMKKTEKVVSIEANTSETTRLRAGAGWMGSNQRNVTLALRLKLQHRCCVLYKQNSCVLYASYTL